MPYPIIYDWSKPCFIQFSGLKPIVNWVASVFPFALHLFLFRSEFQIVDCNCDGYPDWFSQTRLILRHYLKRRSKLLMMGSDFDQIF